MSFFGGKFFAGGFFSSSQQQVVFVGGARDLETWRERTALRIKERNAARLLKRKRTELRKVERQLEAIEAKSASLPAGVLFAPQQFMVLSIRRDAVAVEVVSAEQVLKGIKIALGAFDLDRDEEDLLLLL